MAKHPPNVLDLRRSQFERPPTKRRTSRTRLSLHRPPKEWRVAWAQLGREYAKFGVGLALTGLAVFLVWLILTSVRGLQTVTARAQTGVERIEQGIVALNERRQPAATKLFSQAADELQAAQTTLDQVVPGGALVARLLPYVGSRYVAATELLAAAQSGAAAGLTASSVTVPSDVSTGFTIDTNGIMRGNLGWLAVLANDPNRLQQTADHLLRSYQLVERVNSQAVPASIRPSLEAWQKIGRGLFGTPERLAQVVQLLLGMTTQDEAQEYLFLFQNSDELRATGGFMGSYALVKFQRGTFAITDAPGNGPYALKDQLPKTIRPPVPLDEVTPFLSFQDANWFVDAPASAAVITELYRQARGFAPDGVVFMTPDMLEHLLAITGPVTVDGGTTTVTATSFVKTLEEEAELHYDRSLNAPKQIVIQLLPAVLNRVKSLDMTDALRALTIIMAEADRGNIIVVQPTGQVQQAAAQLGWDGRWSVAQGDGLGLVVSNINSGKTDRQISTNVDLTVKPSVGDWEHIVSIKRQFASVKDDQLADYINTSYLRLQVPAGANLLAIEGASIPPATMFSPPSPETRPLDLLTAPAGLTLSDPVHRTVISHEAGGTTFGFWSVVDPGKSQTITVRYTVPAAAMLADGQWRLSWLRQPGSANQQWSATIDPTGASFRPAQPTSGWAKQQRQWSWTGSGEHSTVLAGAVKIK